MSWQLITLTPEASTLAMLMLDFGGFGLAAFSLGMKVGQIAEAAWWKGKLQEESTREPPTLFRERRDPRTRRVQRAVRAGGERDAAHLRPSVLASSCAGRRSPRGGGPQPRLLRAALGRGPPPPDRTATPG